MPNPLSTEMNALASAFAKAVVDAIRASSVAEILAEEPAHGRSPGRPPASAASPKASPTPTSRAPKQDTHETVELIVAYLRSHPGITGEGARKALGLRKNRWNTCIARGIKGGKVRKEGEKRSTRYWAT
jgi:hypothetical protein